MVVLVKKKQQTLSTKKIVSVVVALLIIIVLISVLTGGRDYDAFAGCLSDKGIIMAGTSWCPHCANQKSMFKGAFEDVTMTTGGYVDCDAKPDWCDEHGVEGYPTWVFPDGATVAGVQKLETLEKLSGCSLS